MPRLISTASWRSVSAHLSPPSEATAVIAAAGTGERLGAGGPKALVEVGGRTLLDWSLDALAATESVTAVVVAAPPGSEDQVTRPGVAVVTGGATRSESVAAAIERVRSEIVVIHDAARPLVSPELIQAVVDALRTNSAVDGVIAATPVTDTIKRVEGHAIVATEDRSALWAAQTPQAFRAAALRAAIAAAGEDAATATDEATLIEWAGGVVAVEPAPASNLKVTTPADLRIAELLLSSR